LEKYTLRVLPLARQGNLDNVTGKSNKSAEFGMAHDECNPHGTWAKDGNQTTNRTKGSSKVDLDMDTHTMPVRVLVTEGTCAVCLQAKPLIYGFDADSRIS
jgi:hypothetical protein